MSETFISQLDELYTRYGYQSRKSKQTRVYLFTKSIYNGADIVKTGTDEEVEKMQAEYSKGGYAVKIREFKSIEEAEDTLFKDFFKADGVIFNLKKRYENLSVS
jgi:acylphosphatase